MNLRQINNFFGDMDLFLMDAILKGHLNESIYTVLDVGCGEGRNALYFMQQGFAYSGWDTDASKLKLLEFAAKSIANENLSFKVQDLRLAHNQNFDFVICSRLLHFATSKEDFELMVSNLNSLTRSGGTLYVSMDSAVDQQLAAFRSEGLAEFPDGKIRYPLTEDGYEQIKKGFEEIEPLKTVVYHRERAQSFMLLRKR